MKTAFLLMCVSVATMIATAQTTIPQNGWYLSDQMVILTDSTWYSLDGSCPSTLGLPGDTIILTDRTSEPNTNSLIDPLCPVEWLPDWQGPQYHGYPYLAPPAHVFKGNALVLSVDSGCTGAETRHHILVDDDGFNRYGIPVISIMADPYYLFSPDSGILVPGYGAPVVLPGREEVQKDIKVDTVNGILITFENGDAQDTVAILFTLTIGSTTELCVDGMGCVTSDEVKGWAHGVILIDFQTPPPSPVEIEVIHVDTVAGTLQAFAGPDTIFAGFYDSVEIGIDTIKIYLEGNYLYSDSFSGIPNGIALYRSYIHVNDPVEILADSVFIDTLLKQATLYGDSIWTIPYHLAIQHGDSFLVYSNNMPMMYGNYMGTDEYLFVGGGVWLWNVEKRPAGEWAANFLWRPEYNKWGDMPKSQYQKDASIALFLSDTTVVFDSKIRVGGNLSRWGKQKPLKLWDIEYPVFSDHTEDDYKKLFLRPVQNPWQPFGDLVMDGVMRKAGYAGYQGFLLTTVLINGEYWGIYPLREEWDEDFLETHFGVNDKKVGVFSFDLVQNPEGTIFLKESGLITLSKYRATNIFFNALASSDISQYIDVESFIDYVVLNYGFGNTDFFSHNTEIWFTESDQRLRWANSDMDGIEENWHTLQDSTSSLLQLYTGTHENALNAGVDSSRQYNTHMFLILVDQKPHRDHFLYRTADLLATALSPRTLAAMTDSIAAAFEPHITENYGRWGGPLDMSLVYNTRDSFKNYIQQRSRAIYGHILYVFPELDTVSVTIDIVTYGTSDCGSSAGGTVRFGTLTHSELFMAPYFYGFNDSVHIPLVAQPRAGYVFSHWEHADSTTDTNPIRSVVLHGDPALFRAVFVLDTTWVCRVEDEEAIRFNEVFAQSGDSLDYIELYNSTDKDISIAGWFITDRLGNLKHELPALTVPADSFLVLIASDDETLGPQHLPFKLSSSDGEELALYGPDSTLVSQVNFPAVINIMESYSWCQSQSVWIHAPETIGNTNDCSELMPPNSIKEAETTSVIIYPNPAHRGEGVIIRTDEIMEYSIISVNGAVVTAGTLDLGINRLENLPAGFYIIHAGQSVLKLVVVD